MCRNIGIKFILWTFMYPCICAYNTHIFRQTYDIKQILSSLTTHIFVQIAFGTRKRHTGFYVFRQGVPEGRSSEGYASFKQVERERERGGGRGREGGRERERELSLIHI